MKKIYPISLIVFLFTLNAFSADFLPVDKVEYQPFASATERLLDAMRYAGAPVREDDAATIRSLLRQTDQKKVLDGIQAILDEYCVAGVHINPESRVKVEAGPVTKDLVQQGWRTFLVKVHNEAGITPQLIAESPNALPQFRKSDASKSPSMDITMADVAQRWLDLVMFDKRPLNPTLSGLALEYRIIQLFSRDVGKREAVLAFNVGQGTQDLGFRNEVAILFRCVPAVEVDLGIKDWNGEPTSAAFVIKDGDGRIYPNPARRLAPDFFFHDQVYRADGESVHLPPGEFTVTVSRGPEYIPITTMLTVESGVVSQHADFKLKRWIHPATRQWYSGDHHVHAAGCAHYENPTEGVSPADMMRHILGEDLNVGCVLTWGPCWYTQKENFEGKVSALSKENYVMRYDVEVSGFPSSHAGHLCLLRLSEDDYPGTTLVEEWPSWTLPVLLWGKKQGAVVGYSHSGLGLSLPDYGPNGQRMRVHDWLFSRLPGPTGRAADILPDYAMPRFDGIGANEYIVTVTHDACDFISSVDTPAIWELNIWYHTLNCGFRTRISGETDFPCVYGDRVGLGRVYVKLDEDQPLDFDAWVRGLKDGRSYVGDGMSHILDFRVNEVAVGEPGSGGKISQLDLDKSGKVKISFDAAALLQPESTSETERIRNSRLDDKPFWHVERSRIGDSRRVLVEIIVNGYPVAKREIVADGSVGHLEFNVDIEESSWVAVRILPTVHTNPVFVEVGGQPIRASKRSAEWCIEAVDTCWNSKKGKILAKDRDTAKRAYDQARKVYQRILAESKSL
ncbi:MAG: CehA/McbA family metallohydrolase [Verrucomicrobia bacterium]|nr:CehA/McbA family metallohydrolase [Verrucomicrobiota bacterium]